MPTDRSPAQCRAHYVNICISPIITRSKWTTDEIERLKLLVRLFKQGRLTANKDEQLARGPLTQTALAGFEEFSTADISRFASALNQDDQESQETKDATSGRQPRNRFNVDWQLISLYMGNRTWKQCYYMWMTLHNKRPGFSCYEGPWSREEDMLLYTLYQQAPNKWSWIASRLPRKRDRQVVRARYISYVGTYVDMLRQCRGAEWDPLADQFEEVHMRCEVLAWYRRQSLGYRPQDPYKCPLDLCMTGL
ncbi:hypothetical protein H4R26_004953 [Coemansia thaxteri]|uniref:Myb-like domain-containing protein n=1 Tax=Coemansia thaxteri TaxID=2663907 RepID=A0A9W8BF64_9FUNG|nr:hypothetical protein H4R26_004953 [Coemansia thaxteri]